jgi:cytochrome c-type biogenesis protein CcmH
MTALTYLVFIAIALVAASFVAWPVVARRHDRSRLILGAAAILFVLGLGGALYLWLGQPVLAVRTLKGNSDRSLNALVGRLARAVARHPDDPRNWAELGEAYEMARDPADAASAFARAIDVAAARREKYSVLYAAYGEALTQASAGAVTPDAEAAFDQAIALDPRDKSARYYLGLAEASRGNAPRALAYWNSLLADTPPGSELRAELVDRIASLTARSGGPAPNIAAMVAGLAARLKANPDDMQGWQRLIRAYAVLGDRPHAQAALADAKKAFAGNSDARTAFDAEAKSLGL